MVVVQHLEHVIRKGIHIVTHVRVVRILQAHLAVMEHRVLLQRSAVVGRHQVLVISVQLIAIVTLVRAARILQAHLAVTEHRGLLQKYVVAGLPPQERAIIALPIHVMIIRVRPDVIRI